MERKLEYGRHPDSLTSIEAFLEEIKEMNFAILREEEEAATEFLSKLRLLIKKSKTAGNNPQIRQWWYYVMTLRPPPLPKHEQKHREVILDRVEEGWQEEDWVITMPQAIHEILQKYSTSIRNPTVTRTSHATEGTQWIRMEELGKALTNRCRAVRELPNKKKKKQEETRDRSTNSEQLEFECQLRTPTQGCIHELLNLGASSSQKLFQSLITNQDLLRLREDMWPSHRTHRKGWWRRAFATAINRQCPTCNGLWTTKQFPPSLAQCLTCSKIGAKKKPSQFKVQDNTVGLIFRSALPEELDWNTRAEDVALSLDAIKRCLINMLVAFDRDSPQTKQRLALPTNFPTKEPSIDQELGSGLRSQN